MLLECQGVRQEAFLKLQDMAVKEAMTIDSSLEGFRKFMADHGLGNPYRVKSVLQRLQDMGLDIVRGSDRPCIETPFLRLLRSVAITDVLRDIKHSARIPIPDSYLLVGIADEGVAYKEAGYQNVFTLQEGQIYGMASSVWQMLSR